ncbi:MAG: glycoside hydrolase family 127 protein [Clostridiales bacterium]|nr:glycoside hydrolase family 127 protein [Clostridiales bacterium]
MSADNKCLPFGLHQVEVTDAYCCNALKKEIDYLLSLEPERLLAGYYENAGLPAPARYGGWEKHLLAGHTLGHYLTAAAQAYANAGTTEAERQALYAKLTACVDGLQVCQQHTKGKLGFLFGGALIDPENVEIQFDNVEQRKTNIFTEAWVPWYNLHKLLSGLLATYECTAYPAALAVAEALGEWAYGRTSTWSEELQATVLATEYGGMNDCLYDLYALTGNPHFAAAAHSFDEVPLFEAVLSGRANVLNNRHANTTIPKFLGAMNRYRTMQGETDASRYLEYAASFWQMVVEHHTYATGGNSEWEHFGMDDVLDAERTSCNNETCNVYNMLKLSKWLYEATGDTKYMAYYENAFFNTILSSQHPESGMTTYFQPMASGYFKVYGTPYESFWCCTGSGMENFTKLNTAVYSHTENAVLVNLYLSSLLRWAEKGIVLRQAADVPASGTVRITVEAAQQPFDLRLRIPAWAEAMQAEVMGKTAPPAVEEGCLVLHQVCAGDTITVELPLHLAAEPLPDNAAVMAFRYGPLVLSAGVGSSKMKTTYTGVEVLIPAEALGEAAVMVLPEGVSQADFLTHLEDYLQKVPGELRFPLRGTGLVFTPHYLRYHDRYAIYLCCMTPAEKAAYEAEQLRNQAMVLDSVQPGYGQYENDVIHCMQEHDTQASTDDGSCRRTLQGGSFTYRMAVNPEGGNELHFLLRQSDNGLTLRITSGGAVLMSRKLDFFGSDEEYPVTVPIPDEIAAKAEPFQHAGTTYHLIPLTFSGVDGQPSARVCEYIRTVCTR